MEWEIQNTNVKTTCNHPHYNWAQIPQFALCSLAFSLLGICPTRVWAQGVINQSSSQGVNLDALFNLPTNTVTVLAGVTIDPSASGSIAVAGSSRTWGLTNAATLDGGSTGVNLGAGGTVDNLTGGSILGGTYGLIISDGNLAVNNAGLISGNDVGLTVNYRGILNNQSGGTIAGGTDGIYGVGSQESIINAGRIIGTNNAGILAGASVNNLSGGSISGSTGIFLNGGLGPVTNSGSITGVQTGVSLFSGGSVDNQANGVIAGGSEGISIIDSASVNNAGTVISTNHEGILLGNGGNLNNQAGGVIWSGGTGVEIDVVPGVVENAGSITGANGDGAVLTGGGSLNNQRGATLVGATFGVEFRGENGAVTNAGTIIGRSGTAIQLYVSTGTVALQTGSDVEGDIAGLENTNTAYLQGNGSYSNSFQNFTSLTVQADATGWSLGGTNAFSTSTEVQTGLLSINGVLTTSQLTVDQGGTLGGGGFIQGSVIVEPAGSIAPGTMGSLATFTVSSNLTIQGGALMKLTAANADSDHLEAYHLTYGGTLTVTNLSTTTPTNGETYQLFSATSCAGAFNAFKLPSLAAGLVWSWNPAEGTLKVISGPASPWQLLSPQLETANIKFSFATMAGQGYTLWGNTNLSTSSWTVITNFTGDGLTDQANLFIPSNRPAGFFRLSQP